MECITFREFQKNAIRTIKWKRGELIVPLLGLAGETGQLLTEFKKSFRDGDKHKLFSQKVMEELGDVLWYASAIAHELNLDLGEIAEMNLTKVDDRWNQDSPNLLFDTKSFDSHFPSQERLPENIELEFKLVDTDHGKKIQLFTDGQPCGDPLTDNSHGNDGYRFHDIFHFAYAMVLGWSPLVRKLMSRKRKSDAKIDEVEDGARARFLEEGISAMVFQYAEEYGYFEGLSTVDFEILKTISVMTKGLEARQLSYKDWENAILMGFNVWRPLFKHGEGKIVGCRTTRSLQFLHPD